MVQDKRPSGADPAGANNPGANHTASPCTRQGESAISHKEVDVGFGKIPSLIVASGGIARLSRSQLATYLAIASHANGNNWAAFPSIATIAREGGMSERTATRTVATLKAKGLLEIAPGGGRKRPNTYTLVTNPDSLSVTLSASAKGDNDGQRRSRNPDRIAKKPRHSEGDTLTQSNVNPDTPVAEEQQQQRNSVEQQKIATAENREELLLLSPVEALAHFDVQEPTASIVLDEVRGVTTADILALAKKAKERRPRNLPGLLVKLIRSEAPELIRQRRTRERSEATASAAAKPVEPEHKWVTDFLEALSDEDIQRYHERTITYWGKQFIGLDPRDRNNRKLRDRIYCDAIMDRSRNTRDVERASAETQDVKEDAMVEVGR